MQTTVPGRRCVPRWMVTSSISASMRRIPRPPIRSSCAVWTVVRKTPSSETSTRTMPPSLCHLTRILPDDTCTTALADASETASTMSSASARGTASCAARSRMNVRMSLSASALAGNVCSTRLLQVLDLHARDTVDLHELQDPPDRRCRRTEDETASSLQRARRGDEDLDPGGVHEGEAGEIERQVSVAQDPVQGGLENVGRRQVELAREHKGRVTLRANRQALGPLARLACLLAGHRRTPLLRPPCGPGSQLGSVSCPECASQPQQGGDPIASQSNQASEPCGPGPGGGRA